MSKRPNISPERYNESYFSLYSIYFSMKYLILIGKGIIIGIGKIIPGVSGAVIAISFGIYERLISIMSKPLKINWDDLKFLTFLLFGAFIGIGFLCKGVKWCLETYYLPTMLLFSGLIIGGMPEITNEIKKGRVNLKIISIFIICFTLVYFLINLQGQGTSNLDNNLLYFLIGAIESLTTIIPGISGTAIFMSLGWYEKLLTLFEEISTFNIDFNIALFFFMGFIISTILISKVITWLFKYKKAFAYTAVLAFMCASLMIMFEDILSCNFSNLQLFIGIILFIFGIWATKKINNFFGKL